MKIVIVGGGFGGSTALKKLSASRMKLDITLINKKKISSFLPMLPDVIGRGVGLKSLSYDIEDFAEDRGCRFINDTVIGVDLAKKEVTTSGGRFDYDYLIIASGSETNFYGQEEVRRHAYKLDDVEDAQKMADAVRKGAFDTFLVAGGGYTGVEVATNLKLYLAKHKLDKEVIIIERAPSLLGPLPQRLKDYTVSNLERLGIKSLVNTTLAKIEGKKIVLSSGEVFENSMLVWAAGVKTDDFIQRLNIAKTPQGRLMVDDYLRINERCFVVGDAANFVHEGRPSRMAVQFSIFQGSCAAANILRHITGLPLKRYKPVDMGYLIPMANNRSCGIVLGIYVFGLIATFLHYAMCIYRSFSMKNKIGIVKGLLI